MPAFCLTTDILFMMFDGAKLCLPIVLLSRFEILAGLYLNMYLLRPNSWGRDRLYTHNRPKHILQYVSNIFFCKKHPSLVGVGLTIHAIDLDCGFKSLHQLILDGRSDYSTTGRKTKIGERGEPHRKLFYNFNFRLVRPWQGLSKQA